MPAAIVFQCCYIVLSGGLDIVMLVLPKGIAASRDVVLLLIAFVADDSSHVIHGHKPLLLVFAASMTSVAYSYAAQLHCSRCRRKCMRTGDFSWRDWILRDLPCVSESARAVFLPWVTCRSLTAIMHLWWIFGCPRQLSALFNGSMTISVTKYIWTQAF